MSAQEPQDRSLGFFLKRAQHSYRTRIDEALRHLELTAPQYAVMAAVKHDPGISNAGLARAAFVTPQTMQGILANLERRGLLARQPHPQHGRVLMTELTERGSAHLSEARRCVEAIEIVLADAAGVDADNLVAVLERCTRALASE